MVPNDLSRQDASEAMHIGLLGSRPDLDLTDLRSNFEIDLSKSKSRYMLRTGSTRQTRWCHFYSRSFHIKKVSNKKRFLWKTLIFHLLISGAKTIVFGQIWSKNVTGGIKEAPERFFRILSSNFGENSACLKKNGFLKNWHLVTSGDLIIGQTWKWP